MNYKKSYIRWVVVFCLAILPVAKSISAELAAPQMVIKNVSDQLKVRLEDKTFASDFGKITEYVDQVIFPAIDFNKISQSVLGPSWKKATPDQQTRFKQEFKTLLIRTYSRAFVEFDEWSIRYLPLRKYSAGVKKVTVRTQVLQPGVKPIGVDYKMGLFEDHWKAYDIQIEGVSLITNYRSSFKNEVKRSGSLESVIAKLANKNNSKSSAINTAENK